MIQVQRVPSWDHWYTKPAQAQPVINVDEAVIEYLERPVYRGSTRPHRAPRRTRTRMRRTRSAASSDDGPSKPLSFRWSFAAGSGLWSR
jgi:hypothetical protein